MTREEAICRLEGGAPFSELYDETWESALVMAIEALKAEPIKHGHWLKLYHGNYKCSECGDWWGSDYNDEVINDFNYCPHCGAKMVKE